MLRKLSLALAGVLISGATLFGFTDVAKAAPAVCPSGNSAVTNFSYTLYGMDGSVRNVTSIVSAVRPGDRVVASFKIANNCKDIQVSLATYRAPSPAWVPTEAAQQELYDSDTGYFSAGYHTLEVFAPTPPGTPGPNCPNSFHGPENGGGANASGPYDTTCDGSASQNGNGEGNANGKPCAGCVGNADNKNPKGQLPNANNDGNNGYECDNNNGVGKSNPAHSGCTTNYFFQIDLVRGEVLPTLGPVGSTNFYGVQGRLLASGHG